MKKELIFVIALIILLPSVFSAQTSSVRSGILIDLGIQVLADTYNGSTTDFIKF